MECCGVMWSDVRCCVGDVWVGWGVCGGRVVDVIPLSCFRMFM